MQYLLLSRVLFPLFLLLAFCNFSCAFTVPKHEHRPTCSAICSRNDDEEFNTIYQSVNEEDTMSLDSFRLNQRISSVKAKWNAKVNLLPPNNPFLDPEEFITTILQEIQRPDNSLPLLGYHVLFHSSSSKWKQVLIQSVAAPILKNTLNQSLLLDENWYADLQNNDDMILFLQALQNAMSRSNNQFQILTMDNAYRLYFPGDVVDYSDGKCWLEVQLRDVKTDKLMVIMGWSLIRKNQDVIDHTNMQECRKKEEKSPPITVQTQPCSSWLIDSLDWQDFRDEFRPGIGREEWERICG